MKPGMAAVVALAMAAQVTCGDSGPVPTNERAGRVDHHLHLASAAAADHLDRVREAMGEGPADDAPSRPTTAEDAILAMDTAGIARGLVLSNAYMFGMPEVAVENEEALVRGENTFVVTEASRFPARLIPLCSVNPLKDYALGEVARCSGDPAVGGLKLHLANSDVDLRRPEDLAALRVVFEAAAAGRLPLLVHMRTRHPEYGADDAEIFIDQVLPAAGSVPVQIAHMAGWGGYDDATDAALWAFVTAIEEERLDASGLTFGLGAVVFSPDAAGPDSTLAASVVQGNARLAERIRALGTDRVVYATDWPSWPPVEDRREGIARNVDLIRGALPLSEDELAEVLDNVGSIVAWER